MEFEGGRNRWKRKEVERQEGGWNQLKKEKKAEYREGCYKKIKGAGEWARRVSSKNKLSVAVVFSLESAEGKCLYNRALFGVNISLLRFPPYIRCPPTTILVDEGEDDDDEFYRTSERKEIRLCNSFFFFSISPCPFTHTLRIKGSLVTSTSSSSRVFLIDLKKPE